MEAGHDSGVRDGESCSDGAAHNSEFEKGEKDGAVALSIGIGDGVGSGAGSAHSSGEGVGTGAGSAHSSGGDVFGGGVDA